MAEIYSYNVGFGNACLVIKRVDTEEASFNVAVLIDAGSIRAGTADLDNIIEHIRTKIMDVLFSNGFLIIMITHPHKDHYSLIYNIIEVLDGTQDRIFVYTGGILFNYLQSKEEKDMISGAEELLEFFRVFFGTGFEQHYFSVVSPSELRHISGYGVNGITSDIANSNLQTLGILLARAYNNVSALSCPPNFNTIIVSIKDEQDQILLFMGDAPAVPFNPLTTINAESVLCSLGVIKGCNIGWYQASHHGSGRNGEFEWLRLVNELADNLGDVVFSNYPAYFKGIPNKAGINDIFPSFFKSDGTKKFTACENADGIVPINFSCLALHSPNLLSTYNHSLLIRGSGAYAVSNTFF